MRFSFTAATAVQKRQLRLPICRGVASLVAVAQRSRARQLWGGLIALTAMPLLVAPSHRPIRVGGQCASAAMALRGTRVLSTMLGAASPSVSAGDHLRTSSPIWGNAPLAKRWIDGPTT